MRMTAMRLLGTLLSVCMLALVTACSGGSAKDVAPAVQMATLSGNGAPPNARLQVFSLSPAGTTGDLLGSSTANGSGAFSVNVPQSASGSPAVVAATTPDGTVLRTLVSSLDASNPLTVTLLTETAFQQLQRVLTQNPSISVTPELLSAVNARVGSFFGLDDLTSPAAAGSSHSATLAVIGQMVKDSGVEQTLGLMNQALADPSSRSYQLFRSQFQSASQTLTAQDPLFQQLIAPVLAQLVSPPAEPVWGDTTRPDPVTNLRAIASADDASSCSVTLTWSPGTTRGSNPVVGYEISRGTVRIRTVSVTTFTDRPLSPQSTFTYFVRVVDAAGKLSDPVSVAVTTPRLPNLTIDAGGQLTTDLLSLPYKDIFPPSVPSGITATATALTATTSSVSLRWNVPGDDTGVVSYELYRDGSKIATVTGTSYIDPSVASGVLHTYDVYALDAAGNRSPKGSVSITPVSPNLTIDAGGQISTGLMNLPYRDITPPAAPGGLTATATAVTATSSQVVLSWQAPVDDVGVVSYEIYRDGSKIATVTGTSYTDPSVASGVLHTYDVYALDAAGNRSPKDSVSVTPVSPNLTINAGGGVTP